MKHRLKITQVLRVEREIVIEREASDLEEAIIEQSCDAAPSDGWKITREELENEDVNPA